MFSLLERLFGRAYCIRSSPPIHTGRTCSSMNHFKEQCHNLTQFTIPKINTFTSSTGSQGSNRLLRNALKQGKS
eukprot:1161516-Pelagomonas_calceolata.AAC.8